MNDLIDKVVSSFLPSPSIAPTMQKAPDFPLFDLSTTVIEAISHRDRGNMLEDMAEADLLHLPFPYIAVRFSADAVSGSFAD